jgi:DNA-directed RNA polymerase specialized sigma24 family protein
MEKINKYMPGYPFLAECCHSATSDLTLVGDLSDLAALLGYSVDELSGKGIADLLADLSEEESRLLTLRFGLEGGLPLSPEETARKLNLTPEEVVTREAAALAKLRGM